MALKEYFFLSSYYFLNPLKTVHFRWCSRVPLTFYICSLFAWNGYVRITRLKLDLLFQFMMRCVGTLPVPTSLTVFGFFFLIFIAFSCLRLWLVQGSSVPNKISPLSMWNSCWANIPEWLHPKFVETNESFLTFQVRYIVPAEDRYRCALALAISNMYVRAMISQKLGINQLPMVR